MLIDLTKLPDHILLQIIQLVELSEQQEPLTINYQEALNKILQERR